MQKHQQDAVDSLRRVQGFLDTPENVVGTLEGTEARKQLDDSVGNAAAHGLGQGTAIREFAGTGHQSKRLAVDLKVDAMTPMAKYARAHLRGAPDFNALARVPHSLRGHSLVAAARAMATAAQPYATEPGADPFLVEGVAALAAAADALQASLDARVAARSKRVIATAGVRDHLALGREAVAMMDPIVTKRLAGRKDLLAGWRSAKRLKAKPRSEVVVAVPAVQAAPTAPAAQEVKTA